MEATQPLWPWHLTILLCCIIFSSLTQAHPLSLNTSLSSELIPQCTSSVDWMNDRYFNPNHCLDALYKLENTDLRVYKSRDIEFLALGAKPRTTLPGIRLPRRYTSEGCTIVIAMLSTITENFLPAQEKQVDEYAITDVSKFSYLWSIAAWIDGKCVSHASSLGWCATGLQQSIGVIMLGTQSKANGFIPGGPTLNNLNRNASRDVDLS
ncbi:MAG: hypothetical protein Q9204_004311 [Flavoplaca sp. TL-2023a]